MTVHGQMSSPFNTLRKNVCFDFHIEKGQYFSLKVIFFSFSALSMSPSATIPSPILYKAR